LKGCYDYNNKECFATIDDVDRGVVNSIALDKFLNRCNIYISDEEFDSFFSLVDLD